MGSGARGGKSAAAEGGTDDFRRDLGRGRGEAEGCRGSLGEARAAQGAAPEERGPGRRRLEGRAGPEGGLEGRGRPEQAGHICGCAYLGRFDDRPPFPSFPPSLSLFWFFGAGGWQALLCEHVLGLGEQAGELGVFALLPLGVFPDRHF